MPSAQKPAPLLLTTLLTLLTLALVGCESDINVTEGPKGQGIIHVLDNGGPHGDTGWWPSLVVDHNDQPHLSYCDAYHGNLMYATREKKTWRTEVVLSEGAVGKYTSIAVAKNGTTGIAFYDQDLKYLRYAFRKPGGDWQTENVSWGLETGMASELRFDANDQAHLFYYLPSGNLAHGRRGADGEWKKTIIQNATGGFSVRIDPHLRDDGIWLSFVDWGFKDTTLYVGHADTLKGKTFTHEVVTPTHGPGWHSQLIFDSPTPSVLYSLNFRRSLRLATRAGGEWKQKTLYRNTGNFATKQASNGDVVVALESKESASPLGGSLRLLRRRGGTWTAHEIDPEGPNASYLALALTKAGEPIVAYYSKVIRGIKIYEGAQAP